MNDLYDINSQSNMNFEKFIFIKMLLSVIILLNYYTVEFDLLLILDSNLNEFL
jgi:hypothetical protein